MNTSSHPLHVATAADLSLQEAGSTWVSESPLRPVTEGDHQGGSTASQAHESVDTSLRVLLAAKTKQEVDTIVAEAFDTADEPLKAMLSRSASHTNAAAGGAGTSAGGVSSLGGMSSLSTGSDSTEKLSAEVEGYKRQVADLQQKLDAKAAAAAAAVAAAKLVSGTSQETMAKLEAQLVSAQAAASEAHAAQQELQQPKAAAEEARKQLLQQVSTLTQEASDLRQLSAQLADAQAANAELSAQSEALQQQLHAAQQQLQDRQLEDQALQRQIDRVTALEAELAALRELQLEKQALQQQLDKIAALEAEVAALRQQLLLAQRPVTHDVSVEADLLTPQGNSKGLSTCSSAAVSAVRAATHSLLLQSNPFEVRGRPVTRCRLHNTLTDILHPGWMCVQLTAALNCAPDPRPLMPLLLCTRSVCCLFCRAAAAGPGARADHAANQQRRRLRAPHQHAGWRGSAVPAAARQGANESHLGAPALPKDGRHGRDAVL